MLNAPSPAPFKKPKKSKLLILSPIQPAKTAPNNSNAMTFMPHSAKTKTARYGMIFTTSFPVTAFTSGVAFSELANRRYNAIVNNAAGMTIFKFA